ncbi:MAG: hypothetical protein Q4B81_00925 [Moraxella sp.]|nr:hypothetical protein [Moraxella sp.]
MGGFHAFCASLVRWLCQLVKGYPTHNRSKSAQKSAHRRTGIPWAAM